MGRRKTPEMREKQAERNKPRRDSSRRLNGSAEILKMRMRKNLEKRRETEMARIMVDVLIAVSADYWKGKVRYCALRTTDRERAAEMQFALEKATREFSALPKEKQTPDILREVGGIIQSLNQRWISDGWLEAGDLRIGELPSGRLHDDGRLEAIDKVSDRDVVDMVRRFRSAISVLKK